MPPPRDLVARERALAERLVVRARRARWDAWLRESAALAAGARTSTEAAGALVRDVVANHDALALGLPGAERFPSPTQGDAVDHTVAGRPTQEVVVERARRFVDEELIPREQAAELAGGRLPAEEVAAVRAAALAAGLNGGLHAVEHGGQGWSHVTWALVEEQLGRSTNGISWHMPNAYNVWSAGSEEQIDRWLRPMLRGEAQDAYAVTEEHAGSDPSGIATTAEPLAGGGWRIRGEKWFVTSGDVADVIIVVAIAPGGADAVPRRDRRRRRHASSRTRPTRTPIRTGTRRCAST